MTRTEPIRFPPSVSPPPARLPQLELARKLLPSSLCSSGEISLEQVVVMVFQEKEDSRDQRKEVNPEAQSLVPISESDLRGSK